MVKKSLIGAIILGAGLALAGKAVAQSQDGFYKRTGDFMLVSDYMHTLDTTKETTVESLIKGGNVKSIYAVDPVIGLQSRIDFLNSDEGKGFYKEEERQLLIGRYNDFIANISKEKRTNYSKSLEQLSLAVKDGAISPKELEGVENGTYMIVKEGIDYTVGKYTALALVNVDSQKEKPVVLSLPDSVKKAGEVENSRLGGATNESNDSLLKAIANYPSIEALKSAPLSGNGKVTEAEIRKMSPLSGNGKVTEAEIRKIRNNIRKEARGKTLWSLTAGANSNFKFDDYGLNVGFRAYPFINKKIGLGLSGDVNFGLNKNLDSHTETLQSGRTFIGTVNEKNRFSVGLTGELQLDWFLLGGGIELGSSIIESSEKILRYEQVLKSNLTSFQNSKIFGDIHTGVEIPITEKLGLDALFGYSWKRGIYFTVGSNLKQLNK